MKRAVFVSILVAASMLVGCELPEPLKVGDPCPGITAENIMWVDTDSCKREGNDACQREAEEAIQLGDGYCPFSVSACRYENNTPKCVHGCSMGKVLCGEDCVNPNTSVSHCGANIRGLCNNDDPNHFDYKGQNCMDAILDENRAFVCDKTECKPTVCNADEYVGSDGECIQNTDDNCGGEGIRCSADEKCVFGECLKNCTHGYIRCHVKNEGMSCIDPQGHESFCGAKGLCISDDENDENYRGKVCAPGEHCVDGECVLLKCGTEENANVLACDGECVDITKDPLNCGGCGNSCANNRPPYVSDSLDSMACDDGKCVYTCAAGYDNCGTDGTTECVDLSENRRHCGACDKVCESNEYCLDGECQTSKCTDENACFQHGSCLTNDPTACGSGCMSCTYELMAYEASCDDVGVCHVTRCQNGFHFASDTTACVPNSPNACGSVDQADAVDCTALPDASDVQCINGKCVVGSCGDGYHLYENTCEENSDEHCSFHDNKCSIPNGTSHCQGGQCVTTGCNPGFHKEGNYCTGDNLNNCGGKDCTAEPGWLGGLCTETTAQCQATNCKPGFYLDGTVCRTNDQNNCGTKGKKCTISNGSSSCNTSTGECSTPTCSPGYHLTADGKSCDGDSNTECGASRTNCMGNTGWGTAICDGGVCKATGCITGYYLDGTTCKANDQSNCGTKGKSCAVSHGSSTCNLNMGTCTSITCDTGYYLDGTTCKANDQNNCGTKGKKCSVSYGVSTCITSSGICQTQSCYDGYYIDGSSCKPNDQSNCGAKGKTCSVDYGVAKCNTSSGVCYVESCNQGYYQDGSNCNRNDQNNCGVKGKTCSVNYGNATCNINNGTCTTTSCYTGYYLDGSDCIRNNQSNCGVKGKTCSVDYGTATCNIDNGTCTTTGCNPGYYQDGSTCKANDQNNCGTKGKSCSVSHGTSTCNINNGTCSRIICDPNYHLTASGTSCTADTNYECGSLRQNCTNMGSRYTGGTCSGGTCVPTGCASGYQMVNDSACVEFCYMAKDSYCCHTPVAQSNCNSSSNSNCNQCRALRMMVDQYGNSVFPYERCVSTACSDAIGLYCDSSTCSSLRSSCNTSSLESNCFFTDRFL